MATVAIMDSGVGGLTVFAEIARALPSAELLYCADDAGFPYGNLTEVQLVERVVRVVEHLVEHHAPEMVVLACNTASTLSLPVLRERFPIPFVGTVPAIKPAAALTRTQRISVLATPATVSRDYTRELIASYAADCAINLTGSALLAEYAEAELRGMPVSDAVIRATIAPAFRDDGEKTDVIVLACTHYPLLLPRFETLAPWPVHWVNPAPAIARRTAMLLGERQGSPSPAKAIFTSGAQLNDALRIAIARYGIGHIAIHPL